MDWIAAGGLLLALGVALDSAVKVGLKRQIVDLIRQSSTSIAPADTLVSFFDRVAGQGLITWKAFKFSVLLTTLSFFLMILAVFLIDGQKAFGELTTSLHSTSLIILLLLPITAIIMYIGDFISFAQTRLFIRSVNIMTDKYVTFIMLIGDILSSMFIFVVFASLARMVSYVLLSVFVFTKPITSHEKIIPHVSIAVARQFSLSDADVTKLSVNNSSAKILNHLKTPLTQENLHQIAAAYREAYLEKGVYPLAIVSNAKKSCIDFDPNMVLTNTELYGAIMSSIRVDAGVLMAKKSKLNTDIWIKMRDRGAIEALNIANNKDKNCPIPSVDLSRSLDLKTMIASINPFDLYIASFGLTMIDTLSSVAKKFADYPVMDPANDIVAFISNAIVANSSGFLSLGGTDDNKMQAINVTNELVNSADVYENHTPLPLATMAASSMMPSFIFLLYLVLRTFSKIWYVSMSIIHKNISILRGDDYVFTYMCSVSIFLVGAIIGAYWLIEKSWELLLR